MHKLRFLTPKKTLNHGVHGEHGEKPQNVGWAEQLYREAQQIRAFKGNY
jgi:hypothetical protein